MEYLLILQSNGILKNARSYILTNRERRELITSFNSLDNLSKTNKTSKDNFNPTDLDQESFKLVSKNLTLKEMINMSLTNKKMREIMKPIIEDKKKELESYTKLIEKISSKIYTIEKLDQETDLDLNFGKLTKIPNFNLPKLKKLNLFGNKLTSIPTLMFLPNLQRLDLSLNELTSIPNLNLPNLQYLYLSNNQLTELPNLNLPNLKKLVLSYNKLTSIPKLSFPNLQKFSFIDNPLSETEKERLRSIYGDKIIFEDI